MNLLIVESPKKAKTIGQMLGPDWRVCASFGHIRDLPQKDLGIDLATFRPSYVVSPDKKENVGKLKIFAAQANTVFLATDPDREGESIAWHLKVVLQLQEPKRVRFHEITPAAIQKALANPAPLHVNLVRAQEARRVADRLVGYQVSPVLCNQSGQALSAGRVQSPALRLVVDLENVIRNFVPQQYFEITIVLDMGLTMKHNPKNCSPDGKHLFDSEFAAKIKSVKRVCITEVSVKKREVKPKSPLTTSLLQQVASSIFKISPGKTMEIAQGLFESGAITYHRTDNPNMSRDGFDAACAWLSANGHITAAKPFVWSSKANAQEAHEAIRPTDFAAHQVSEDPDIQRVYALIRERALASAMPAAEEEVTIVDAVSEETYLYRHPEKEAPSQIKALFKTTAVRELSPGWRSLMRLDTVEEGKEELAKIEKLPRLGDVHQVSKASSESKSTQPPGRYTEGSLIKKLENLGIGRPSTYASILNSIITKKYIQIGAGKGRKGKADNSLYPTALGEGIVKALTCQQFMDYQFTSALEEHLDEIANGNKTYLSVVEALNQTLQADLPKIRIDSTLIPKPYLEADCPKCGGQLKRLKSKDKDSHFWVHMDDDHTCDKFLSDEDGTPVAKTAAVEQSCPYCQQTVKRVKSSRDQQWCWVHAAPPPAECQLFLSDLDGTPVRKA